MALLLAITCILGNKHETQKTVIEKLSVLMLLVAVMGYSLTPQKVLAFETKLDNSPNKRLVAPVTVLHSESFQDGAQVVREPEYSKRMAGSVMARQIIETKTNGWQTTRLVYAGNDYAPKTKPVVGRPIVLRGQASYYSRAGCLGCNPMRIMANGQPLNDSALTMAIGANLKHLVGHRAKVTNLNTGQSVDVLITDTGGFYQSKYGSRVADLTIATKQAIGMTGGLGQVRVEIY